MLTSQMVSLLCALLGLSILTRETSLFLLSLILLVSASLSWLWERYCLEGVVYLRRFSQSQVSFGAEIELEIQIVNRKLLPLSWLEAEDEIPASLPPAKGHVVPSYKPGRALLVGLLAIRPYERVRRRYTIPCTVRGEHIFGPVTLRSGDLFGFNTREQVIGLETSLVVYPRVVPLTQLGFPACNPLGDLRAQSWLFEDVNRIAGARDYQPSDDLRRIHWPASAKAQKLQVKVYEATTSHKLAIFLDLETNEGAWTPGYDPDVQELSITSAASIACWGLEQGYQVGVFTNGTHRGSVRPVGVEPGSGPGQLQRILLVLAKLQPMVVQRFDELLVQQSRGFPLGTTAIMVTPTLTAKTIGAARILQRGGHAVVAILTGRKAAGGSLEGITLRRVGPPEAWRDAELLALA